MNIVLPKYLLVEDYTDIKAYQLFMNYAIYFIGIY